MADELVEDELMGEEAQETRPGMSDDDLLRAVQDKVERSAVNYYDSEIWQDRIKAWDYYYGRPLGNEELGRSQIVSSDVYDTIESELPGLIEVFASSEDAIKVTASLVLDDAEYQAAREKAKQANAFVQTVIWKQNPGFLNFYNWFKDGLLQKNGILYWYPEEITEVKEHSLQVTADQLLALRDREDVEIVSALDRSQLTQDQFGNPVEISLFDLRVKVKHTRRKVCITVVPPNEFIPDTDARSPRPADMRYCAMVTPKTVSECRLLGYDIPDDVADTSPFTRDDLIQASRQTGTIDSRLVESGEVDPSMRTVWLRDCYIKIDYDGDGIAELRNVLYVGNKLLRNEIASHIPFACFTPTPLQHQFYGWSKADETMEIARLKTALWRSALDALYLSNDPRIKVGKNSGVELDDLLTSRPGGLIRADDIHQIEPIVAPYQTPGLAYQGIEYVDSVREQRTGSTRYNQGLDANSLNKTARGVSLIFNASQQRQKLRARIAAEVGVKDLVMGIIRTWKEYGDASMIVEVEGKRHAIDPSQWGEDFDIDINVGTGTADKEQMMMMLNQVANAQVMAMRMGADGQLVTMKHIYNTQKKILEVVGIKTVDDHWLDPSKAQPQPPKPNPEVEKAKLDAQTEIEKEKIRAQTKIITEQMSLQAKNVVPLVPGAM